MLYCFAVQLTGFVITLKIYSAVLTICATREHFSLPTRYICEFHMVAITHSDTPTYSSICWLSYLRCSCSL